MRAEILRGGTDELVLGLLVNGRPAVPSSCSARILDCGVLLDSGIATGGRFRPSSSVVSKARQDLVVEWTFRREAVSPEERRVELFDVVLFRLVPVISDHDLIQEAPSLVGEEYVYRGEAAGPAAPGLEDRRLVGAREDWAGAIIQILSGADAGRQYVVSAFAPDAGVVTYPATIQVTAGDRFLLRRSFQGEIEAAWSDVYDKLTQACAAAPDGSRPSLIMSSDRLRRPHLMRALEKVYRARASDTSGVDWARAEYYGKEFEAVWNGLKLVFASDVSTDPVPSREGSVQFGFGR